MKKLYLLLSLSILASLTKAQITINSTDLMNAGDEYNMSVGDLLQTVDFTTTGPNTNWDFSALTYLTQEKDSFFTVSSLGGPLTTYPLVFDNILFPANKANIVQVANNFGLLSQLPIAITDIYNFYYKNTSVFRQAGMGATVTGIEIPLVYTNKDIIYNFPVNFNDADSSNSDAQSPPLPGLGSFGFTRTRVNNVDGWGSITTPFGTFDALRVRSVVNETDTIYIDSLGFGISLPQPETVEYKWLAAGQGVPVLQINTTNAGIGETVSSIRYRDSVRITAVVELNTVDLFSVSPNPANEATVVSFQLKNNSSVTLTLYAVDGRLVTEIVNEKLAAGIHNYSLKPGHPKLSNGIYLLELKSDGKTMFKKVVIAG